MAIDAQPTHFQIISPVDGSVYAERPFHTLEQAQKVSEQSRLAQKDWAQRSIQERAKYCSALVDALLADTDRVAEELTMQMGRPISQSPGEMRGFEERARYMIDIAEESLSPVIPTPKSGFSRSIQRAPLGVVLDLPAWNFPYLTAVNALIPALMAGNAVILKHANQTALCADRLADAARTADLPQGLFATLDLNYAQTEAFVRSGASDFVCFTGSVFGGRAIERAATESHSFLGVGLELGGKDPAYVRADADLGFAIENIVDGAMFNSGQSCCGIERVYVHRDLYDNFVEGAVALIGSIYKLDDPRKADTNIGPMVRKDAAAKVRAQINAAVKAGATAHIDPEAFPQDAWGSPYLAPQVLTNVTHDMEVMIEETFGPVMGIMSVDSDAQAIQMMNDCKYGLTASVWTKDMQVMKTIAPQLESGTVFMNRCDYLDPGLAWTGVKETGRGTTLSKVGYEALTRPQSWHFREHP